MAGEDNTERKGPKPLGKSKITGSEVNLKYPEWVQDPCSLPYPVANNATWIHLIDVKPMGAAGIWVRIHKKANLTPKSENQNVAGELQAEKVQTSFLMSGWVITRSLRGNLGDIISFSLLRNLSPGRIERTLIRLSALSLSKSSWRRWSQKNFMCF